MNQNNKSFVKLLKCPITGAALIPLDKNELDDLNQKAKNKQLFTTDGMLVDKPLQEGLITIDKKFVYLVVNDILMMLPQHAIPLSKNKVDINFGDNKKIVQNYYESFGWEQADENNFQDAAQFEDLREVSKKYIHNCHTRLNKYLGHGGQYLLDVASGPVQYDEYLTYSNNFQIRVCADFSFPALKLAKKKLKDKGVYLLADITNLPLANNSMSGVISLHTVYHVPADQQIKAFNELFRVLKPNGKATIVYAWANPILINLVMRPIRIVKSVKSGFNLLLKEKKPQISPTPQLYFNPHSYNWFKKQNWPFNYSIYSWRSVSLDLQQFFVHKYLGGKILLGIIYGWESRCPKLAGKIGQYPVIVINK